MTAVKRFSLTVAGAAAVLALILVYAYFAEYKGREKEKEAKARAEQVFDLKKEDATKLTLVTGGGGRIVMEKIEEEAAAEAKEKAKEPRWRIVEPVATAADEVEVNGIVGRMADLKSEKVIEEEAKDLGKYGLVSPRIRVAVSRKGGEDLVLKVGVKNEFDGTIYVARGDEKKVMLASGSLEYSVDKDLFKLRQKKILPFEANDAVRFSVSGEEADYSLEKKEGKWRLARPVEDMADESAVNGLISNVRYLQAKSFAAENAADLAAYGLDKPALTLTVGLEGGAREETVIVGRVKSDAAEKIYAKRVSGPAVMEIEDKIFKDMKKETFDLRNKDVAQFERDDVKFIKIDSDEGTVQIEKAEKKKPDDPEEWSITSPVVGKTKKYKISSLLSDLKYMKAKKFADENPSDLAQYGLEKPSRTYTLAKQDGTDAAKLSVGKPADDGYYVSGNARKGALVVEKSRIDGLPFRLADLQEEAPKDGGK